MPSVTVVGAGPVGSLLALTLARRGWQVDLFERRPDMRRVDLGAGRSINLAVSTRGLHALSQVGLDRDVLDNAIPMLGRMTHAVDGKLALLRYGRDDSEFINSMSRGGLNRLLMTRAEESGRVRIHFGQRLVGYDFGKGTALLRDDAGVERGVEAKVIVGADGSASALRAAMPTATVSQEVLDYGYKELTMPAAASGGFQLEKNALHLWPRGAFMLIALPNLDGSFTCTLFLSFAGLAKLSTPAEAQAFAGEWFPDAVPRIPDLGEQLVAAPTGQMVTVRAEPWSSGSALLIGDAAHAIVPFFGQGMNAGFEDVTLLQETLDAHPDPAEAFDAFWRARKPDADAIATLALENFVEMRDKVADPEFLRQRALEAEVQKRLPSYRTRYQLVTFTRTPYRVALQTGQIQQRILAEERDPDRAIAALKRALGR